MFGMGNGRSRRGRSRRRWIDDGVETMGLRIQQLQKVDRDHVGAERCGQCCQ